ncbi:ParB/RepB/Spo0J family partition protein [Oricola cellulosilytica]|uniref:ParB/RepB/Spo0J family partition protein n=1 Tax=Oricola cellulosilytica TaxID=1429082 RepID=A0A4R0PHC0_9HYPH|nr:ParB/RepB/Spo0J family partition protein [Oricola cellulosilytica]TCD15980.1 ParB/RepB/Spo0J family partition protein [Oricola cellulosilytica]
MAEEASRKRLGRGLAALIGEMDAPAESAPAPLASDRTMPVEFVHRNRDNPRREFSDEELNDLASSIREHGILQPVVVRPWPDDLGGNFQIIAGERRWRAAQRAGLTEIPVIVRDVDDKTALELAIIENVQRSDLNPIEEAAGYQRLIDEHDYSQAELGDVIGKSRSHVANTLRLLKLPLAVQEHVQHGELSAGHARALVTAKEPDTLARRIINEGLSVRQAESLAQDSSAGTKNRGSRPTAQPEKDADTLALEKLLTDQLGLRVSIVHGGKGGEVRIRYSALEQLDSLCHRLQGL